MEELRFRVAQLRGAVVVLVLAQLVTILVFSYGIRRKEIVADRITAREFVVSDNGRKVGHFGLTSERPGEVVLILKDNPEHIVALNVAPNFSGAIVKSGEDEQKMYANDRARKVYGFAPPSAPLSPSNVQCVKYATLEVTH